MERPNAIRVNLNLFYDYRKNVELYPVWQKFLWENQPKTIIFWGQTDISSHRQAETLILRDLPNAEMHRLEAGHVAVEDHLDYIVSNIKRSYAERSQGKNNGFRR